MFEKNKCPRCGFFVKKSWNFCPECGFNLKNTEPIIPEPLMMGGVFNMDDISKDINSMLKAMFGESPIKGSISITSHMSPKGPRIHVKTSGDYKKVEPEIKKKLGVKRKLIKPKVTEEPEIKVKEMPHENVIEIQLPGVKKEEDIEIYKQEQSIELKAFTKDKVYFRLIPIPENSEIIEKELEGDILRIRLRK